MKRAFFIILLALPALLFNAAANARDLTDIIASGKIRVAIAEEPFIPWLTRDGEGKPIGFEVDVAHDLADGLGVEVEFVETPFRDLIGLLTAGEADLIVSALSITPERARRVLFSDPYGQSDLELVVANSRLPEGAADESYDMEGMRIAVVSDTTTEIEGRDRFRNSEIVTFPDLGAAQDAFLSGDVNAIIAVKPYPAFIQSLDPEDYVSPGDPLSSTVEAVAVGPSDQRLLNYVNSWIAQAIASGFLEEATHHWFETLDWVDQVPGLKEEIEALQGDGGSNN